MQTDFQIFFAEFFASKAARNGAVIRRKVRDVERMVGRDVFLAEIRRRGFTVIENAGQFVVFCNSEPVSLAHPNSEAEFVPKNVAFFEGPMATR